MVIGSVKIYGSNALTAGPSMALSMGPGSVTASANAWIVAPEISGGAGGSLSLTPSSMSLSVMAMFNVCRFAIVCSFSFSFSFSKHLMFDVFLPLILQNDFMASISAGIPLVPGGSVSFSASVTLANLVSNPAFVSALQTWGNELPSIPTSGGWLDAEGALYNTCNAVLDGACAAWNNFRGSLTSVSAASLQAISFSLSVSGTLGTGAPSFAANIEMSIDGFNLGPYSVAYKSGSSFGSQFAAFGTQIWQDIAARFPAAKYF
jgi:hypothetical protein